MDIKTLLPSIIGTYAEINETKVNWRLEHVEFHWGREAEMKVEGSDHFLEGIQQVEIVYGVI